MTPRRGPAPETAGHARRRAGGPRRATRDRPSPGRGIGRSASCQGGPCGPARRARTPTKVRAPGCGRRRRAGRTTPSGGRRRPSAPMHRRGRGYTSPPRGVRGRAGIDRAEHSLSENRPQGPTEAAEQGRSASVRSSRLVDVGEAAARSCPRPGFTRDSDASIRSTRLPGLRPSVTPVPGRGPTMGPTVLGPRCFALARSVHDSQSIATRQATISENNVRVPNAESHDFNERAAMIQFRGSRAARSSREPRRATRR